MNRQLEYRLITTLSACLLLLAASASAQCVTKTLSCPSGTVSDSITAQDCASSAAGKRYDAFEFSGTAGDTIIVKVDSNIAMDILLFNPDSGREAIVVDTPAVNNTLVHTLSSTGTWSIFVRDNIPGQTGNYTVTMTCGSPTAANLSRRFRLTVRWKTPDGASGEGQAVPLTNDTGYFWFFSNTNVELVVKVLDACSFSNRFWVFAAALTNVEVDLTVTDTQTGRQKTYHNPMNTAFAPIQDTDAFATCP